MEDTNKSENYEEFDLYASSKCTWSYKSLNKSPNTKKITDHICTDKVTDSISEATSSTHSTSEVKTNVNSTEVMGQKFTKNAYKSIIGCKEPVRTNKSAVLEKISNVTSTSNNLSDKSVELKHQDFSNTAGYVEYSNGYFSDGSSSENENVLQTRYSVNHSYQSDITGDDDKSSPSLLDTSKSQIISKSTLAKDNEKEGLFGKGLSEPILDTNCESETMKTKPHKMPEAGVKPNTFQNLVQQYNSATVSKKEKESAQQKKYETKNSKRPNIHETGEDLEEDNEVIPFTIREEVVEISPVESLIDDFFNGSFKIEKYKTTNKEESGLFTSGYKSKIKENLSIKKQKDKNQNQLNYKKFDSKSTTSSSTVSSQVKKTANIQKESSSNSNLNMKAAKAKSLGYFATEKGKSKNAKSISIKSKRKQKDAKMEFNSREIKSKMSSMEMYDLPVRGNDYALSITSINSNDSTSLNLEIKNEKMTHMPKAAKNRNKRNSSIIASQRIEKMNKIENTTDSNYESDSETEISLLPNRKIEDNTYESIANNSVSKLSTTSNSNDYIDIQDRKTKGKSTDTVFSNIHKGNKRDRICASQKIKEKKIKEKKNEDENKACSLTNTKFKTTETNKINDSTETDKSSLSTTSTKSNVSFMDKKRNKKRVSLGTPTSVHRRKKRNDPIFTEQRIKVNRMKDTLDYCNSKYDENEGGVSVIKEDTRTENNNENNENGSFTRFMKLSYKKINNEKNSKYKSKKDKLFNYNKKNNCNSLFSLENSVDIFHNNENTTASYNEQCEKFSEGSKFQNANFSEISSVDKQDIENKNQSMLLYNKKKTWSDLEMELLNNRVTGISKTMILRSAVQRNNINNKNWLTMKNTSLTCPTVSNKTDMHSKSKSKDVSKEIVPKSFGNSSILEKTMSAMNKCVAGLVPYENGLHDNNASEFNDTDYSASAMAMQEFFSTVTLIKRKNGNCTAKRISSYSARKDISIKSRKRKFDVSTKNENQYDNNYISYDNGSFIKQGSIESQKSHSANVIDNPWEQLLQEFNSPRKIMKEKDSCKSFKNKRPISDVKEKCNTQKENTSAVILNTSSVSQKTNALQLYMNDINCNRQITYTPRTFIKDNSEDLTSNFGVNSCCIQKENYFNSNDELRNSDNFFIEENKSEFDKSKDILNCIPKNDKFMQEYQHQKEDKNFSPTDELKISGNFYMEKNKRKLNNSKGILQSTPRNDKFIQECQNQNGDNFFNANDELKNSENFCVDESNKRKHHTSEDILNSTPRNEKFVKQNMEELQHKNTHSINLTETNTGKKTGREKYQKYLRDLFKNQNSEGASTPKALILKPVSPKNKMVKAKFIPLKNEDLFSLSSSDSDTEKREASGILFNILDK